MPGRLVTVFQRLEARFGQATAARGGEGEHVGGEREAEAAEAVSGVGDLYLPEGSPPAHHPRRATKPQSISVYS